MRNRSIILSSATRVLVPLMLLLSLFLLWRGHNAPGGGFVAGLVAASGVCLRAIADGVDSARRVARVQPETLIIAGLLLAGISALIGPLISLPFMTGVWTETPLPLLGVLGTPIVFDVGVYLLVVGVVLTIVFSLMEE